MSLSAERDALVTERGAVARLTAQRDALSAERNRFAPSSQPRRVRSTLFRGASSRRTNRSPRAEATSRILAVNTAEKNTLRGKAGFRLPGDHELRSPANGEALKAIHDLVSFSMNTITSKRIRMCARRDWMPRRHYLVLGGTEGRDPGPYFSTGAYLARHSDVADAGLNPLLHYETNGRRENRGALPYSAASGSAAPDGPTTLTSSPQSSNDAVHLQSPSPAPWRPRDPFRAANGGTRRVCIFSFYDPHGWSTTTSSSFCASSASSLRRSSSIRTARCRAIWRSSCKGRRRRRGPPAQRRLRRIGLQGGVERIEYNREGLYDELLMVNHTCFGPVFRFSELFLAKWRAETATSGACRRMRR